MKDEEYRLKMELAAREEESSGAWVGILVVVAMISALVLVLALACGSFMVAL